MLEKKKMYIVIGTILVLIIMLTGIFFIKKNQVRGGKNAIALTDIGNDSTDSQSYWIPDVHGVAKGDSGYYYIATDKNRYFLKYFDEASKTSIPVCGKADCMHNDASCNAYFPLETYDIGRIYYYQNNIYMIQKENGMGVLVRIKPDGTSREKVTELFPVDKTSSISLVFHDSDVYAYDSRGHNGSEEEATEVLKKVSLDGKNTQDVYEYSGVSGSITGARSFGDKLFFIVRNYKVDKSTLQQTLITHLYAYDYNSGEAELVSDKVISGYYVDMEDSTLYYFAVGEGLYKYGFNTKEQSLIYKANESMVYASLSMDAKYLYLGNGGMGSTTDARASIDRYVYVLDKDGNEINKLKIEKSDALYYGDNKYLFVRKNDKLAYLDKSKIENASESDWITVD